ncbi:MAG: methyl-accepting chemotaxis protein [Vicinamibacterales bacterium]
MQNWTVGRRIAAGFAAMGLIAAALVITFERGLSVLSTEHTLSTEGEENALTITRAAAMGAELYQIIADGEINLNLQETRADWAEARKTSSARLDAVEKIASTEQERGFVKTARQHHSAMADLFERELLPILDREGHATDETRAIDGRIDEQAAALAQALQAFAEFNVKEADAAKAQYLEQQASTQRLVLIMIVVGVLLSIGVAIGVTRGVTNRLNSAVMSLDEGARQVVSASDQVAGSAQSLSQGATEQAASLEETSASMEEMASMTRRNAENTRQAVTLVTDVHVKVNDSQAALQDMVQSMTAIQESSEKVSKIIKTIDEIAFQTNILALNAAVEAARAGEAGMGFAVVADEVRSLAQRSAQAAKDTAGLIEESISKSRNGSVKVEQVAAAITGITSSVNRVKGLIDEVSEASHQQTQGIDQVASALSQMEKVTQGTAATAEESAAASEELSAQANTTMEVVGELRALVGVSGTTAAAAPVAKRNAGKMGKVVSLATRAPKAAPTASQPSNEELFPLEKTGTFGSF